MEVETLKDKLVEVESKALIATLADRLVEVKIYTLCDTVSDVETKVVVYTLLAYRLTEVEIEKLGEILAKVQA